MEIQTAWADLEEAVMVLGPAQDGGYWLIGLREARPRLFEEIPWSTAGARAATMKRAAELGLRTKLLAEKSDVDTAGDWMAYLSRKKDETTSA